MSPNQQLLIFILRYIDHRF